jgi:hypothetical protein
MSQLIAAAYKEPVDDSAPNQPWTVAIRRFFRKYVHAHQLHGGSVRLGGPLRSHLPFLPAYRLPRLPIVLLSSSPAPCPSYHEAGCTMHGGDSSGDAPPPHHPVFMTANRCASSILLGPRCFCLCLPSHCHQCPVPSSGRRPHSSEAPWVPHQRPWRGWTRQPCGGHRHHHDRGPALRVQGGVHAPGPAGAAAARVVRHWVGAAKDTPCGGPASSEAPRG